MLRRNDLVEHLEAEPAELVAKVQDVAYHEPTADNVYSIAEVAYVSAKRLEERGRPKQALDFYATAAANAYFYLFDKTFERDAIPMIPAFDERAICTTIRSNRLCDSSVNRAC